ncbi:MAG: beta-ketoacyl synthase N-terminal-like domain-containing protein [Dissulfurispiraceae bacterium]
MVITGKCRLESTHIEEALSKLDGLIKPMRLVHELERLAVAAVGGALLDAGLSLPLGDSTVSMYIGIGDAIEDIKDAYFNGILTEGILGASPLLFPFTSPNALAAQVSIAFDLRGEGIVIPISGSCCDVIEYATDCIDGEYAEKAITGTITIKDRKLSREEGRYAAEFFFVEREVDAVRRGARIYNSLGVKQS